MAMTPSQRLVDMFAAAGVQQPEDSIGFLLWRVAHRHQREVDRALAPLGLTHLQFAMLVQTAWLTRDTDGIPQAELGRFSKVHPMQLSSVLKALEAKDLITRTRCPGHGRAKYLVLTDAAVALLATALPQVTALQGDFFGSDPVFGHDLHDRLRRVVAGWGDDD
jgi:DNA-binding MarR family transcriptional regulator